MFGRALSLAGVAVLAAVVPLVLWQYLGGIHPVTDIARPALVLAAMAVVLALGLGRVLGDVDRGAVLVAIPALAALAMLDRTVGGIVLLAGGAVVLLIERRLDYRKLGVLLLVAGVLTGATPMQRVAQVALAAPARPAPNPDLQGATLRVKPWILHSVMDGYGAPETLAEIYDHDPAPFIAALEARGFVVFRDAVAPYNQTLPIMASIFSAAPAPMVAPGGDAFANRDLLGDTVRHGPVLGLLEGQGYHVAATTSGYDYVEFPAPERLDAATAGLNGIEVALLSPLTDTPAVRHFNGTLRAALEPGLMDGLPAPFFVYQHLLAPHPPFTIDAEGRDRAAPSVQIFDASHAVKGDAARRQDYVRGYRDKARFVETAILRQFDALPPGPRVVILQGDHGPGSMVDQESADNSCMAERMRTFLAVHTDVPEIRAALIRVRDDSYVTANIYRTLLGAMTDRPLPLLDMRPTFLPWSRPWDAQVIDSARLSARCSVR